MKKLLILLMIICASCAYSLEITCEKGMEKYKPLVEEQICKPLQEVYETRLDACAFFVNDEELSKELGYLLGCEDYFKNIRLKVRYAFYDSKIIETTLNNIKIMSFDKVDKSKRFSAGYVVYSFPGEDAVDLTFSSIIQEGYEQDFYLPIFIDKEGKIVKEKEIVDGLISLGGNTHNKTPLMLFGIVDEIQSEILKTKFSFSRWYNDGMSYKIASLILHKQNYKYADEFDKLFAVTDKSKEMRANVNLLSFPQINLVDIQTKNQDLETANIQYSCELLTNLYNKVGREGFHKINMELKSSPFLSSEQICRVTKLVTDCDFYPMFLEYVPEATRQLLDTTKYNALAEEGKKLMEDKKYQEPITIYKSLLEANPYDYNARLNLAKCYRETGELFLAEEAIFIAANSMPMGQATININGDIDCHFLAVLGKYLYMQGALGDALKILKQSYDLEPAPDVKQVIDSINLTKENMRKELYGGN